MAISEQLQQRINNLTQGMGATSNKEMEMLKDASPSNMQFDVEIDGKNRQFGFDSQPDEQAMQMLRDRLNIQKDDFGADATKPLDDLLISLGIGDIADLNMMSGDQKLKMAQTMMAMNMANKTKGAISNREMDLFMDASPSNLIQLSNGQDIQVVRENDPSINQFIEAGYRMVPSPSTSINVGPTKGAISNREMELFRNASPSMGTIGGGRMEIGDGSPSMGAIGGGRMEMFRPSMGTMGGGRAPISDQERQMFMDSMPRQADETQQAIDSLTQELQMTTDPEEAEGLGQMIQKLLVQTKAPFSDRAKELAQLGGGEDTALAHLRPGEIVLPPEMMEDPRFEKMVEDKFKGLGIDPAQAVVGMGIASLNESTGLEEFGFFKKLGKKLGKVVKKVAPLAVLVPGIGTALGGALGGLGGLATKGLAKVGLGGLGSALGSVGSTVMGGIANAGIPGLSSIAGGTAQSFGGIKAGLGSLKGLVGDGPLSGLLGGGQQPSIEEVGAGDPMAQVRIDRLRSEGMSDAQIMQNLQQAGMAPQASGGRSIFGGGTPGQSRIGMIEDMLKNRPSDPVRQGGGMFGGGQGGGLGALGTAGLLGLAGSLGKMAYDETKKDKGVPLTPLNTMNAAGRFNLEAEIARRMGQQAPNPVEFGLLPQNTMPELSGGQAVPTGMNMGGQVMPMGYNMGGRPMMPMQYAEGGNVSMEDFERQNGMINGEGTETSDDVPAMLSDGEFVMTGQAVRGAGSYELQQGDGGILNLIPSLDEDRERGTELLYNMMEVFGNRANAS